MKKIHIKILIVLMAFSIVSCKKTLEKLLNNPNLPTPSSADVDLYINEVELSFNSFFTGVGDYSAALSRQQNWGGPLYQNAYSPPSFDGIWTTAYSSVINNADALIPVAESQSKFIQAGIAEILKAYTLGTLVDVFNDVPDSQSELGTANPNPKVDAAATVYAHVQTLLDAAITDLSKPNAAAITSDLFYNGSAANWITLANTLKLKFYMQTRLVDNTASAKIKALIVANNLINTPDQDFQFQYGTTNSSPDSRSEHYAEDYKASGGEGEYLSNYFMWTVAAKKYNNVDEVLNDPGRTPGTVVNDGDPRLRYYFYRQVDNINSLDAGTTPCIVQATPAWYTNVNVDYPYCLPGTKGYYGRDHGDNSAAPPDANYRSAWGIYPAGGQFDANQAALVSLYMGGQGAGINPIWQSAFTKFLEAEAALTLGITDAGDAPTLLTAGVSASITKVISFPGTIGVTPPAAFVPTSAQIQTYVDLVSKNYTSATTTQAKLNVVMSEYYIALWGNGIEAYNNLRRTGMPLDLQPAATTANPGIFMYSFFYPSVYENRNLNAAPQKNPGLAGNHVFWDNNPDNFVK